LIVVFAMIMFHVAKLRYMQHTSLIV